MDGSYDRGVVHLEDIKDKRVAAVRCVRPRRSVVSDPPTKLLEAAERDRAWHGAQQPQGELHLQ